MALDKMIRLRRGTRSQFETLRSANGLTQGEPYLITDDPAIAVGLTASTAIEVPANAVTSATVDVVVKLTASQYAALTPDAATLYVIVG